MDTLRTDPVSPTPALPPPDLHAELSALLSKIDANLAVFAQLFPDDTTQHNVYMARPARAGLAPGANAGWTTGFWTGQLWLAYELTGEAKYRAAAEAQGRDFARRLSERVDVDHHDLGFLYSLSSVAAYRLTGDEASRAVSLAAAETLMQRYWDTPGVLQAWGPMDDPACQGQIIIDCLMNLPLLLWAAEQSGEERFRAAALCHAGQSARSLVRADATTFHTFFFDVHSGAPRFGRTAQGLSDDSCWARGQAWGVYGFALIHAHAPERDFLRVARRLADHFLARLGDDLLAYWDLTFGPGSAEPRDSSASAILACGLFELARQLPDAEAERYRAAAYDILSVLARSCSTRDHPESNALLLHGVGSKPHGMGVDEASLWGDYFYLEALVRATRPWTPYW